MSQFKTLYPIRAVMDFVPAAKSINRQPALHRLFNTKMTPKRSQYKSKHVSNQLRLSAPHYLALKRRIEWNKFRKSQHGRKQPVVTELPRHRRSLYRVSSNDSVESGFEIVPVEKKNSNYLYLATERLPSDLLRYLCGFLKHETFVCMPRINRRIHHVFPPAVWGRLIDQRVENIVANNLDALWSNSYNRNRVAPCYFGRPLSAQSCRAFIQRDGSLNFRRDSQERGRPLEVVSKLSSSLSIMLERVFDFDLYLQSALSSDKRSYSQPEIAFRMCNLNGAAHASVWQALVLKRFVQELSDANWKRAPGLMESSTLGDCTFVLPSSLR